MGTRGQRKFLTPHSALLKGIGKEEAGVFELFN
jgi:hypothetical protein